MDTFAQRHARTGPNAQEASPAGAAAEANDYSFECEDGPNVTWQVLQMELVEALFEPYALTVELTTDDVDAELDDMLGASCRLWIERGEQQRCVPGIVHRLDTSETDGRLLHVRAFVRPALWLLTQRIDSRTWQHLSAPEILREVLTAPLAQHGREIVFDLRGTYSEREYCVQYRESDYGFACRLMEEEGISFYFDREDDNERLVLTDTNDLYPSVPTEPNAPDFVVPWVDNPDQAAGSQAVWSLHSSQELTSTSVVRRDFDWRTPGDRSVSESRATDHRGFDREVFDPGQQHTSARGGEQLVARQREALAVQRRRFRGQGNIVGFSPGHVFELPDHPHASSDPRYLLTRVVHESGTTDAAGADRPAQPDLEYGSSFECIPLDVPFRPLPRHTRPRIHGPQTALVTGPEGDQIHTDEHGRIRVLMRWDRDAPADDRSSCWVRVAQASAGAGWGTMFVPRVGMEVVVEFLDGNPDCPLVTGCVYNGDNTPPYALPEERTKTTIKTCSTPVGGVYNELRFEDACGQEEVLVHAGKDLNVDVANNERATVGSDRSVSVGADQSVSIGGNHTETVMMAKAETVGLAKAETIGLAKALTIGAAYQVSVAAAMNETIGISRSEQVFGGKSSRVGISSAETVGRDKSIDAGGKISHVAGKSISLDAATNIRLDADENISLDADQYASIYAKKDFSARADKGAEVSAADNIVIDAGKQVLIGAGAKTTAPGKSIAMKANDHVEVAAEKMVMIAAGTKLKIMCGKASIVLDKSGKIVLSGTTIDLNP